MQSVLVVMDDPLLAGLIDYKLSKSGYAVRSAEDGAQASNLLTRESFDALLLDVMIPKLDGFRLLHELRKPGRRAPRAILVLTARAGEDDMLRAFELGAVDYIVKPFSLNVLVKRIEIALGRGAEPAAGPEAAARPAQLIT